MEISKMSTTLKQSEGHNKCIALSLSLSYFSLPLSFLKAGRKTNRYRMTHLINKANIFLP